mmetsp:Transcript_12029/g.23460  ORF Transcript_12029/g.23460 Transcript_12029/m.23460 type:complete len:132 (-) Transcript_12029:37-432(-)
MSWPWEEQGMLLPDHRHRNIILVGRNRRRGCGGMKVRLLLWLRSLRMGWFDFDGFCMMNSFLLGMLHLCGKASEEGKVMGMVVDGVLETDYGIYCIHGIKYLNVTLNKFLRISYKILYRVGIALTMMHLYH